ncbi:MAG TPA: hypothetical protein VL356_12820 [Acidocella sp.]|nr:hypothetical protein [Acidocella sp.]
MRLHPNAAALYAAKVADLQAALNDTAIRAEAAESLGSLIEKVVLTPDGTAPDGLAAETARRLTTSGLKTAFLPIHVARENALEWASKLSVRVMAQMFSSSSPLCRARPREV